VSHPAQTDGTHAWNSFPAAGAGPAFAPMQNPQDLDVLYHSVDNAYCRLRNVPNDEVKLARTSSSRRRADGDHMCHTKCARVVTNEPECAGYILDVDAPAVDSGALCIQESECRTLCDRLGDRCSGIDMHKALPRCYLNTEECGGYPGKYEVMGADTSYKFLAKATAPGPQLNSVNASSSPDVLRFAPITVEQGSYKVCFCDSELGACSEASDYALEIGRLHVSGATCLSSLPSSGLSCKDQQHGGQVCSLPPLQAIAAP